MITTLLLVPVIGSLFLLPLNENTPESRTTLKQIAIATSLINLLVSVFL
jgi:NADH-ubiquinone oxidoreductase chain 4